MFDEWKYICNGRGSLKEFSGKETVYYKNSEVYLMKYFAGIIE
jgi:hypothetical protein